MRLVFIVTMFLNIMEIGCSENKLHTEEYIVEILENCSDTLILNPRNIGEYYHCGIGVTFSHKYNKEGNFLSVTIYDFEYQHKPSNKVAIAELKFEKNNKHLKLISIKDLHEHYPGEFRYLQKFLNSEKFKRVSKG
jgi:hypothetical protein